MYMCMYVCMCICMCIYIYLYIDIYLYMYVCVYIYIYIRYIYVYSIYVNHDIQFIKTMYYLVVLFCGITFCFSLRTNPVSIYRCLPVFTWTVRTISLRSPRRNPPVEAEHAEEEGGENGQILRPHRTHCRRDQWGGVPSVLRWVPGIPQHWHLLGHLADAFIQNYLE